MRAGWMRPSWSSLSSVSRAVSRRTPSKPESRTAPGVSSMMKSIPVSVSRARMLRPSRPMMRPLSSSDFSSTTDTVVSTAWLEATLCMTAARMLRARRSASWRVSSSTWRMTRALSWRSSSSSACMRICLACPALSPATRSSSRICLVFVSFRSSRVCSRLRCRSSSERSRSPSCWDWASSELSLARRRSSSRAISARRARSSSSAASEPATGAAVAVAVAGPIAELGCRDCPRSDLCGARALYEQHHGHGDRCRHQRRQHDLHLDVSSVPAQLRRPRQSVSERSCSAPRDTSTDSHAERAPVWRAPCSSYGPSRGPRPARTRRMPSACACPSRLVGGGHGPQRSRFAGCFSLNRRPSDRFHRRVTGCRVSRKRARASAHG